MPKSNREMARASMARRRQRAREAGLCYTCCRQEPQPRRTVCLSCNAARVERTRHKRQKIRETKYRYALIAHERAGDVARDHDFHVAAAQHYQDALNVATATSEDRDRISEKLIQALFLSGKPGAVNPLYDRLLTLYLATPENAARAIDIMLKIARQLWVDSKTNEALPIIMQAMQLAERIGKRKLWIRTILVMHNFYTLLGRYDEAIQLLNNICRVGNERAASLPILYYKRRAIEAAITGQAMKAYQYFERVLPIIKKENDLYRIVTTWQNYSDCALILGDMDLAKSCVERALLISREHRFIWYIPRLCLMYAHILTLLGQFTSAYGYLLEALSSDARAPVLERVFAGVGIPLALQMNDEVALAKCAHPAALTLAFQSEESESINSVAAAFAKLSYIRGDREAAQALLHRAVKAVRPIAHGWELPLEIARQGAVSDIPRARKLLEARTALPRNTVALACLSLFDAHVAQRESKISSSHVHAKDALKQFEALRWHPYADEARSLLPRIQNTPQSNRNYSLPFTDMQSVLTTREQQVAGFVLRGFTNRAIAEELSITENTVEKHMTSIMNRFEIRSRHQLAAAISPARDSGFRDAEESDSW